MSIPLYFQFIFKRLFCAFLLIHFSVLCIYFSLELLSIPSHPAFNKLFFHFLSIALSKADFFLTLSFLLASIQTIQSLKHHGELTALLASGVSKFFIATPFLVLSIFITLFSYWDMEFGIIKAREWKIKSHKKKYELHLPSFQVKYLPDQSRIIYQENDSRVFDLYWITSENTLLHCKSISKENEKLVGHFVDKLRKNPLGRFEKEESYQDFTLPFLIEDGIERFIPPEKSPLSKIFQTLTNESLIASTDRAKLITSFIYKCVHPLFPFLALTALFLFLFPARSLNSYFAFLIAIFSYLLFYSMMKTFIILGENYFVSPWLTVLIIPVTIQGALTYKLCKN